MFIGHWAPALAAAACTRDAPKLATLFIGAQLVDWAFFAFGLVGIENLRIDPAASVLTPVDLYDMPFTHSLLGSAVFALVFGIILVVRRHYAGAALLGAAVVLSHWFLDWLVHVPDLTIAGGAEKHGLGLWNYPAIAIPLELALLLGAFVYYLRQTRGPIGPAMVLLVVMLALQTVAWTGIAPAESPTMFYLTGLVAFGVVTLLAKWVGDTRWHRAQAGLAVPSAYR